ncbi:SAF domain-containing protein [Promicromonospora vindobonensis]|uniref:SAF domain-containing protein n=1 Tax=Promicromonospora vindobonensis TaxID=195748 RepID=A0ABW5VRQ0_9MICO
MSSSTKVANQEKHARSAAQPQRPAPPGPLKPTRARRRPALIALGLALVALSVLASVYLASMFGQTYQVLAIKDEIPRGTEITAAHVATVDLPTGPTLLEPIRAEQFDQVVGQGKVATADLKKGQLLTSDSFADELQPAAGRSIVGVALAPNQMPTKELRAGDTVRVVETPASGGEPPASAPFAIPATVVGTKLSPIGDQTVVDVEVTSDSAAGLAARAATGRVAIVIDAVGAG